MASNNEAVRRYFFRETNQRERSKFIQEAKITDDKLYKMEESIAKPKISRRIIHRRNTSASAPTTPKPQQITRRRQTENPSSSSSHRQNKIRMAFDHVANLNIINSLAAQPNPTRFSRRTKVNDNSSPSNVEKTVTKTTKFTPTAQIRLQSLVPVQHPPTLQQENRVRVESESCNEFSMSQQISPVYHNEAEKTQVTTSMICHNQPHPDSSLFTVSSASQDTIHCSQSQIQPSQGKISLDVRAEPRNAPGFLKPPANLQIFLVYLDRHNQLD